MENGLTTTGGNQVASYAKNPFEDYGEQASGRSNIVGKLLKFSKGDWLAGQNNDEIADKLGLKEKDVSKHSAEIRKKLKLKTDNALIRYAVCWIETGVV